MAAEITEEFGPADVLVNNADLMLFYHRCRERNVYNETLRPKLLIFTFNAGAADFITSPFNINKSLLL